MTEQPRTPLARVVIAILLACTIGEGVSFYAAAYSSIGIDGSGGWRDFARRALSLPLVSFPAWLIAGGIAAWLAHSRNVGRTIFAFVVGGTLSVIAAAAAVTFNERQDSRTAACVAAAVAILLPLIAGAVAMKREGGRASVPPGGAS